MGNDGFGQLGKIIATEFQSTFPRGERPVPNGSEQTTKRISIHVPTWGTTLVNPAMVKTSRFQSTFPRGERPGALPVSYHSQDFNPRSHVGNDSKFSQIFFAFLCNKYNFSTFYYPFSLFFGVIHFTFLIFAVRILPIFYVYF